MHGLLLFGKRGLGTPASIFLRPSFAASPLPVGAAEARTARGAFGVLQGVLAQARLEREAQRLGQPARCALEAREDRIATERVAGGELRPDEARGVRYPAVVVETLAADPCQRPFVRTDAVAQLERGQLAPRLAQEKVEVIVVEPAPLARRVVLQHAENLFQHGQPLVSLP